jgi:GT2 family glycosyltransferase
VPGTTPPIPDAFGAERTATLTVDAADATVAVDLSAADRWHVLVLHAGHPAARVDLASPGAVSGRALPTAAILRWADAKAARDALVARLRDRLGLPNAGTTAPPLDCSVVVCTHRRPDDVRRLLDGLAQLDPPPYEIVVVDNDPGDADCRDAVLAAGARYVREDRRGLDNARNAGIAAARAPIVVFTDDDCVPSPGWLRRLPEAFANPNVAAVTGPAFPHVLDTPARRRMERQASLARGLRRLEFDWLTFPVAGAGAIGVGANMAFRRAALAALGAAPFAPELDAGTATESGGDTYVIAKLLARGQRIVYDPATFVYHRHREDGAALHRAVYGYGVGLGAALAKLLVEDRELSAPEIWRWLLSQYRKTQQRRLAGLADAVETRLAWDYVRGGLAGPLRWRRALREAAASAPAPAPAAPADPAPAAPADPAPTGPADRPAAVAPAAAGPPEIAVVVPTHERPDALDRCLRALAEQDAGAERFEVVVVDDARGEPAPIDPSHAAGLRLRVLRTHGAGAAAARNAGAEAASAPLLLFLDDDVVAGRELVRRHLERHAREGAGAIVVGPYAPRPVRATLAASAAALWWEDLFAALGHTGASTYAGVLTGNLSIAREAFARSGGFDARFGRYRREDWEWGIRALGAGLALHYEPAAHALHAYALDAAGRLRAAELEGHGDALLLAAHPHAGSAMLPLVTGALQAGGRTRALQSAAWSSPLVRRAALGALGGLERARLRLAWVRVFNAVQRLSYQQGVRSAGLPSPAPQEPLLDLDLDGDGPIPPPALLAPTLRVRVGGREVARVRPALGQWTPELADQIVDAVPWQEVDRAAAASGCRPRREERHAHVRRTLVVFGPAHAASERAHRDELAAAGAEVAEPPGAAAGHWAAVAAAAAASERELVALPLPGVRPDLRWLEEALVGFDGARVAAVLGRALSDGEPPAPMVLHARGAEPGAEDLRLDAVTTPHYLVVRRELLALDAAGAEQGGLAPVLALVEQLLDAGWTIGYRDVHGLAGTGPSRFDGARSHAAVRMQRGRRSRATAVAELRRTTLVAAWHLARRRDRRAALQTYAGALAGLLRS